MPHRPCFARWCAGAALLFVVGFGPACQTRYVRSRVADLLDSVPVSVSRGWGIGISGRATPLLHLGLAATPIVSTRYGYEDRLFYGRWHEYQSSFPWVYWAESLFEMPPAPPEHGFIERGGLPFVYRLQVKRDAPLGEGERNYYWEPNPSSWGRHPPIVREVRGALVIPEQRHLLEYYDERLQQGDDDVLLTIGSPERATWWRTDRRGTATPRGWDLFELDGMLGVVGLRIGVRPAEFLDFVIGFTTIDIMGDDLPDPVVWEPVVQPDPDLP